MWRQPKLEMTDEHVRTLRGLQVDENGPGTILRDFESLLTFVRGRDVRVSKTRQLLSSSALPQINALMSHPIEVRLKRPVLKSYPHIQGLYLLLRATELGQTRGPASQPALVIDPQLHESWTALNLTERYFVLLETWFLRGDPDIVGERSSPLNSSLSQLANGAEVIHLAGDGDLAIVDNDQVGLYWRYAPGRMGFALMEMFGFLSVTDRPPQEGEGWLVDTVCATPLGEAVYALLARELLTDVTLLVGLLDTPQLPPGALQPIVAPYVPQWQRSLASSSWAFREGRYVFRAALGRGLWRRIAIDAEELLDVLAGAILDAYAFDRDHLYEFTYRNRFGLETSVLHPVMQEGPSTNEVRVGDVSLAVGQSMTYLFDFGDHWEFEVKLEKIEPAGSAPRGPTLIEGRGEAPEQYPNWEEQEW